MERIDSYANYGDADLLRYWLKGSRAAFTALYDRYAPPLINKATQKTYSREVARELVQDTFVELLRHRDSLKTDSCLYGYLFTILRNKISNYHRRLQVEQRYQEHARLTNELSEPGVDKILEDKELKNKIEVILRQMSPRRSAVFRLRWESRRSNKEIAKLLNISVNTVEQHIRKARDLIRKSLSGYGPGCIMILLFFSRSQLQLYF